MVPQLLNAKVDIILFVKDFSMPTPSHKVNVNKEAHTQKTTITCKKKMSFLVLIAVLLFSGINIPVLSARVEASSGNDVIFVEPSSIERKTKFLAIGEKITGEITVNEGDNVIIFKLYDPSGNLCFWLNVLQSSEFSWGPVDFDGEYLFLFDNGYGSSNRNMVNLEFQITSTLDNSFPTTLVLVIAAVLVAIIVPVAILLRRRGKKNRLPQPNELRNDQIAANLYGHSPNSYVLC